MREKVERFLRTQLADDPLVASTLMIFSLNGPDKRENASEIIQKYLTNLIENPDENKYRRIRMNNKIFQVIFNFYIFNAFGYYIYCLNLSPYTCTLI